ncbi:MAG: hypothetical protein DRJ05_12705 [Bacteroidetes bacterium]|nr:MAG: hypothetical protein DRJ05_12705 [Bacteroidota bacterium]
MRGFPKFSLFLAPFRVRGKAGKVKILNYVQFVVHTTTIRNIFLIKNDYICIRFFIKSCD